MSKKKNINQEQKRVLIFTKEYKGYLDEMPEELRLARESRNPKAAKLFEKWVSPAPIVE